LENQLQREKKALEVAQEEVSALNARIYKLSSQINDLLTSNNEYLVCTVIIQFLLLCTHLLYYQYV